MPLNDSPTCLRSKGCNVVDLTNYTLSIMQKAFSNREGQFEVMGCTNYVKVCLEVNDMYGWYRRNQL